MVFARWCDNESAAGCTVFYDRLLPRWMTISLAVFGVIVVFGS